MLFEFCILYQNYSLLVNKVGNRESIAVILKRFDALSPAARENSSEARLEFTAVARLRATLGD